MSVRLNIGAGATRIEGWTPIDRKLGTEAYPLKYEDNSVDEIRASHILEHFSFREAEQALREWVRVLKVGSRIRVAVPDVDWIAQHPEDPLRFHYLMGGQTDDNDFHRSAYDETRLRKLMKAVGITNVQRWTSNNTDTAASPCSLNLEGVKSAEPPTESAPDTVRICAYMTLPRYEAVAARSIIEGSLKELGIPLATSQGVYWGQCMQRMFTQAVDDGVEWILSLDSDSLFNAPHVSLLLDEFAKVPHADAMAALQCRRGKPFPLMTVGQNQQIEIKTLDPVLATTAHFGLTLIRVDALRTVPKPWFKTELDENNDYGDNRLDDDIWFWHQWRLSGKTLYVAPRVSIGHLEETVAIFDANLQPKHEYIHEWRQRNLTMRQFDS